MRGAFLGCPASRRGLRPTWWGSPATRGRTCRSWPSLRWSSSTASSCEPRSASAVAEDDPRLDLLLALADDELIIGHRHSEWTGWVPHLEEDLAFSSIAQDEMAHARLLYGLALPLMGDGWDEDRLALGREPAEYRNAVLCERPNRDWGYSLA